MPTNTASWRKYRARKRLLKCFAGGNVLQVEMYGNLPGHPREIIGF